MDAWTSQSLNDKPFLVLGSNGDVLVIDPAGGRVLRFDRDGNLLQVWGGFENDYLMGVIHGVAVAGDGKVWVTDATYDAVLEFNPDVNPYHPLVKSC